MSQLTKGRRTNGLDPSLTSADAERLLQRTAKLMLLEITKNDVGGVSAIYTVDKL
jgi:hypothetical protein